MNTRPLLPGLCVAVALGACAQAASKVADVESFDGFELRGAAQVRIERIDAAQSRVELSASASTLEAVEVSVVDGTLLIVVDGEDVDTDDLVVAIATPSPLRRIVSSGAIDLAAAGLRGAELVVEDRGAGRYRFDDLAVDTLRVNSRGAAEFRIAGAVESQAVSIAGAGAYHASALVSAIAKIDIKGAGSASVQAAEVLDVTIAGTGMVRYAGDPEVRPRIYGAGVVKKLNSI